MRKLVKRLWRDNRGTAMLEFVISFMLVLIIWAGICNFSLLLKERLALASAAREAGRETAVSGDLHAGINRGYEVLQAEGITPDRSRVLVYQPASNLFAVEVTCRSPVFLPLVNGLMGGSPFDSEITIHETKYYRFEETPGG